MKWAPEQMDRDDVRVRRILPEHLETVVNRGSTNGRADDTLSSRRGSRRESNAADPTRRDENEPAHDETPEAVQRYKDRGVAAVARTGR